jgi:sec-independent protein translocase protein TatB
MIEISFAKLVVLALIALIVLGPEKLPVVARTAGALIRRVRGGWDTVRAEVERELEVEEIRRAAREVVAQKDAVQAELNATLKQVQDVARTVTADDPAVPVAIARDEPALTQDAREPDAAAAELAAAAAPVDDLFAGAVVSPATGDTAASATAEPKHGSV